MDSAHVASQGLPCGEILIARIAVELNWGYACLVDPRLLCRLGLSYHLVGSLLDSHLGIEALFLYLLQALHDLLLFTDTL